MTHKRQLIREAIRLRLEQIPALAGRCHSTRSRPVEARELPAAIIYTLNETSELANFDGTLARTLTGVVEIRASAAGAIDNALDDLSEEIERTLAVDPRFGGLVRLSFLTGTTIGIDGEGESRQAVATLSYELQYDTDAAGN